MPSLCTYAMMIGEYVQMQELQVKVGFTGTQQGMSKWQEACLKELLVQLSCTELHHGDCIGADAEAHNIARQLGGIKVVGYPCDIESKRAHCLVDEVKAVLKPLVRNKLIVQSVEYLIVAPRTNEEELRSGTWSTYRYARQVGKPLKILLR